MKKTLSVILSVFLLVGMAGCGSRAAGDDIAGGRGDAAQAVTLSRTETTSVYGVEAPGSDENILLGAGLLAANAPREGQKISSAPQGEVRAVWMSYLTLEPMVKGKTKAQFTANVGAAFKKAADFGFNTVFVQVRPFGDALYASDFFPWSRYLTGTEGQDPGYDPLEIMCALADEEGLRIEAWLNPTACGSATSRCRATTRRKSGSGRAATRRSRNGGVYYNPGSPAARKLIVNGVREIVRNYDVDGVHFDDYFYPTTDFAFDSATYRASGSNLSQADWRRENVDILVREVYAAIKELKPACLFGISPQGNVKTNYESQFADASVWLSNPRLCRLHLPAGLLRLRQRDLPLRRDGEEMGGHDQGGRHQALCGHRGLQDRHRGHVGGRGPRRVARDHRPARPDGDDRAGREALRRRGLLQL